MQAMAIRPRRRRAVTAPRILYYVVCTVLSLVFLFPTAWTAITSIKPHDEANASPPTFLPTHISWDTYATLNGFGSGFGHYVGNSALVAVGTVLGTIILSVLGGYGFSRFRVRGRNVIFVTILATLMIPFQSILTPLFLVLHAIHLQNTLLGLALVYITFQPPFAIFMMRNSFDNVPRELEEAALLDGCTPVSLLYRVMLSIVRPGIYPAHVGGAHGLTARRHRAGRLAARTAAPASGRAHGTSRRDVARCGPRQRAARRRRRGLGAGPLLVRRTRAPGLPPQG